MKNLGEDNISLFFRAASIHSHFFALSLNRYIRLRACISMYICLYVCMYVCGMGEERNLLKAQVSGQFGGGRWVISWFVPNVGLRLSEGDLLIYERMKVCLCMMMDVGIALYCIVYKAR